MSTAARLATQQASSDDLRRLAASILSQRRFHGAPLAQPFDPVLRRLGRWLNDFFSLAAHVPGGTGVFWLVLGAAVLGGAVWFSRRTLGRLSPAGPGRASHSTLAAGEDPRALEHAATAAERGGAFGESIRLRFRAGLLSLGAQGAIEYTDSVRTAEVSRRLTSEDFDRLSATFERAAYGGAEVDADDARDAREGWQRVLSGAGR